jgi:hypothetical protein
MKELKEPLILFDKLPLRPRFKANQVALETVFVRARSSTDKRPGAQYPNFKATQIAI